ncbi:unnamed protein product, partial [Tilletia laevis]
RTGHGDFAEYHDRFRHLDAERWSLCGKLRSPFHPLTCPAFTRHHALLLDGEGNRHTNEALVNDKKGILALLAFARASGAYTRELYARIDGGGA